MPLPLFADTQIHHLFATPVVVSSLPPELAARINAGIRAMLLGKEAVTPSVQASNYGGWQSDDKIVEWGGDGVALVVEAVREQIDSLTIRLHRDGATRGGIPWKINGWANINRRGDSNVPHIHPGAYWSAAYYVAVDGGGDVGGDAGGAFKAFDPRGGLPLMYCPVLRAGIDGHMTAGNAELVHPRPGQCVIFPSWMSHAVGAYRGDGVRISLAFNFSV